MAYTKQTWNNEEAGGTALSATRLNHIENGIEDASDRLDGVDGEIESLSSGKETAGAATAAVSAHVAASDPHSQYTTSAELSTALAGYSATGHTHTSSNITDFTTAVNNLIQAVVGAAPTALNTLDELAQALNDDANFASTITTALATKATLASPTFTGTVTTPRLITPPVSLTDAATIATDASLGNHFRVTLGGNRTLGNPTNPTDGQRVIWEITQDGTGSRTLAYGTAFGFGSDITSPTLSTTAGAKDYIGAVYSSAASKWHVLAVSKGY